ncbi:MAG: hypothetical protein GX892_14495 [Thermoanaerobacteraceae bacterium]|nr:hypothetical protein [Thermoanaerobacteraceae bacterium]
MGCYETEIIDEKSAIREIAECNHRLNDLINAMNELGVPPEKWSDNMMVQYYIKRLKKARSVLVQKLL